MTGPSALRKHTLTGRDSKCVHVCVVCYFKSGEEKKDKSNAQCQISKADGAIPEPNILQVYKKLYIKPTNYSGAHLNIQMPQNNNNKKQTEDTQHNEKLDIYKTHTT